MPTTKECRALFVRAEMAERRLAKVETLVMAAIVWSYSNDENVQAKNALLLAIEEYEDTDPDATHDALIEADRLAGLVSTSPSPAVKP